MPPATEPSAVAWTDEVPEDEPQSSSWQMTCQIVFIKQAVSTFLPSSLSMSCSLMGMLMKQAFEAVLACCLAAVSCRSGMAANVHVLAAVARGLIVNLNLILMSW